MKQTTVQRIGASLLIFIAILFVACTQQTVIRTPGQVLVNNTTVYNVTETNPQVITPIIVTTPTPAQSNTTINNQYNQYTTNTNTTYTNSTTYNNNTYVNGTA